MKKDWRRCAKNLRNSEVIFDLEAKISRLNELQKTQEDSQFWNDPEAAKAVLKEQKRISTMVENYEGLNRELDDTAVLLELAL